MTANIFRNPKLKTTSVYFYVVIFMFFFSLSQAQDTDVHNTSRAIMLKLDYGIQFPVGKLSDRFGNNFVASGSVEYMLPSSLFFGVTYDFLFGNNVNEDVLSSIRTNNGAIIGNNGRYADLFLRERGAFLGLTVGKIFPINPINRKTGIRVSLSPGLFKHDVRLNDESNSVTHIQGNYISGYDRKTGGFGLKYFVGYQILSRDRRKNFVLGFEALHGFTKDLRPVDFNAQIENSGVRFDQLYGFKVSWILPFYSDEREPEEIFY